MTVIVVGAGLEGMTAAYAQTIEHRLLRIEEEINAEMPYLPYSTREYLDIIKLAELEYCSLQEDNSLDYAPCNPKRCLKAHKHSALLMCRRSLHPT